jgi:hypothetical protein
MFHKPTLSNNSVHESVAWVTISAMTLLTGSLE